MAFIPQDRPPALLFAQIPRHQGSIELEVAFSKRLVKTLAEKAGMSKTDLDVFINEEKKKFFEDQEAKIMQARRESGRYDGR